MTPKSKHKLTNYEKRMIEKFYGKCPTMAYINGYLSMDYAIKHDNLTTEIRQKLRKYYGLKNFTVT